MNTYYKEIIKSRAEKLYPITIRDEVYIPVFYSSLLLLTSMNKNDIKEKLDLIQYHEMEFDYSLIRGVVEGDLNSDDIEFIKDCMKIMCERYKGIQSTCLKNISMLDVDFKDDIYFRLPGKSIYDIEEKIENKLKDEILNEDICLEFGTDEIIGISFVRYYCKTKEMVSEITDKILNLPV